MANWDLSWRPGLPYESGLLFSTEISAFEGGGEQRHKRWSGGKQVITVDIVNTDTATKDAIKAFHKARYGSYDTFVFPDFSETIIGSRLACTNTNPDKITDSSSGFVLKGFDASHGVAIAGSVAGNDGYYGVQAVTAGIITLDTAETLAAESGNAALEIFKTYNVRFAADDLKPVAAACSWLWNISFDLIEVV